ncbi:hypothetical protein Tco_1305003 [Tanacetum coccineum]
MALSNSTDKSSVSWKESSCQSTLVSDTIDVRETKFAKETKVAKEVIVISSSDDEDSSDDAVSSDEELTSHESLNDGDIPEYHFAMSKASNSKVYTSSASKAS